MMVEHRYLFNFAVSGSPSAFKRLRSYAKWFNENGGAWFIIHPRRDRLMSQFPKNRFFIAAQSRYQRIFNDCAYLGDIRKEIGRPDLYYSYGIPVYSRFGNVNWFHLSNVLPLASRGIPVPLFDRLRHGLLGRRINQYLNNADVISAESKSSLGFIDSKYADRLFLSVNGSDDELTHLENECDQPKDNIALVLGTWRHKALDDSYRVFEMLTRDNSELTLMIIGDENAVPKYLRRKKNTIVTGVLQRSDVIECLRRAKYYISTTRIENSYNAASEGIFFADESYISDIGPHRELLLNIPFERISVPGIDRRVLHVKRRNASPANLKTWDEVISEVIKKVRASL